MKCEICGGEHTGDGSGSGSMRECRDNLKRLLDEERKDSEKAVRISNQHIDETHRLQERLNEMAGLVVDAREQLETVTKERDAMRPIVAAAIAWRHSTREDVNVELANRRTCKWHHG